MNRHDFRAQFSAARLLRSFRRANRLPFDHSMLIDHGFRGVVVAACCWGPRA